MANRTDPAARNIRGTNPQNLVEQILRNKIYLHTYWKEQCFGLTAETLVDKAMELDHIGGTYGGNRKPTPFMCLVVKMLQIQPDKDIVVEFIKNDEYKPDGEEHARYINSIHALSHEDGTNPADKDIVFVFIINDEYVRVLGAFYLRLTGMDVDVYRYLEPLYNDYRKLRQKTQDGRFSLTHVDEFIDELLTKDYSCDIALPRIKKRWNLETIGSLEPRKSALEDDFEEEEEKDEEDELNTELDAHDKDYYRGRSPDRERDRDRKRDSHRYRDRERDRDRDYDKDRDYDRDHGRSRDRDRDRERDRHRLREREREREGRDRDRRERDRGRRRSYSRSRSRTPDRKDKDEGEHRKRHARDSASPRRRNPEDEQKKKKPKKEKKDDGTDHPDPEIAEANRLRASLGLKPLK